MATRQQSRRVYDADVYAFERMPLHYWAETAGADAGYPRPSPASDISCDVAVIGGGYTGLSAADRLAKEHHLDVCVLEAGAAIGWGASGMNGGFVSMGGAHMSAAEMMQRVGEEETKRYWQCQIEAVNHVRDVMIDGVIACDATGDGNLCVAHHPRIAEDLEAEAQLLSRRLGVDAQFITASRFRSDYHAGPETFGALHVRPGFGIHPMKFVRGLAQAAAKAGAKIMTGAEVVEVQRSGRAFGLRLSNGAHVRAKRLVMATNAYAPNGLAKNLDNRVLPAISSIIVTQVYGADEMGSRGFLSTTPIYNGRHILSYYRRLPDGRLLFGGRGDTMGSASAAGRQEAKTLARLKHILPAFGDAKIDYSWRGLVGLTARRTLALGLDPDEPRIAFAFGCQGSGIATMTWAGRMTADLVAGKKTERDIPALFRGLPRRLAPSPALLRLGLRGAYGLYALRDRCNI